MAELPIYIHTAEQVRALDRHAIELGTPAYELMSRAGEAALRSLRTAWPSAQRIVVVCGCGNNAGDGYVLARLARSAGLSVVTIALFDPVQLQGDALVAWRDFVASGGSADEWDEEALVGVDVVVDAIFGTGLSRPLEARLGNCVDAINRSGVPVMALDIPSGLHADTGQALGAVIKASRTICFVGLKLGYYVGIGPDQVGVLEFDALGVDDSGGAIVARRIEECWLAEVLQPRSRSAHKGNNGRVLLIGGNRGMAGAALLAGEATLRVGAGLVTVATRTENIAAIVSDRPELMTHSVESSDALAPLITAADVIAIGPGLGQDDWARAMFNAVLATDKSLVVDADALNLLSARPSARGNWILTPHPGEAGRLLGCTTIEIQADRLASARAIAERYRGTVVLKGAGSIVERAGETPFICDAGNPGMATAGMGDVLTGVIAGLQAQLDDAFLAARAGVLVHALAGDKAAKAGQRGLIASDLFPHLRSLVNPHA